MCASPALTIAASCSAGCRTRGTGPTSEAWCRAASRQDHRGGAGSAAAAGQAVQAWRDGCRDLRHHHLNIRMPTSASATSVPGRRTESRRAGFVRLIDRYGKGRGGGRDQGRCARARLVRAHIAEIPTGCTTRRRSSTPMASSTTAQIALTIPPNPAIRSALISRARRHLSRAYELGAGDHLFGSLSRRAPHLPGHSPSSGAFSAQIKRHRHLPRRPVSRPCPAARRRSRSASPKPSVPRFGTGHLDKVTAPAGSSGNFARWAASTR